MELKQLKAFIAVAEELNFRRAAERLHMTQPPLSMQIRKLEDELGVRLLERGRNKAVRLTAGGEALLEGARATLAVASRSVESSRRAAKGESGRLAVGYSDDFAFRLVPELLIEFRARHPGVYLEYGEGASFTLVERVVDGSLDAAFICLPPSALAGRLELVPLPHSSIVAVVPADHRLARRRRVWLRELRDDLFHVMPERIRSGFSIHVARLFAQAGFVPSQQVGGMPTIMNLELISRGLGVTLASEGSIPPGYPGIHLLHLRDQQANLELAMVANPTNVSAPLAAFRRAVEERAS
jgi:DNA-binding transcriptional LysR family regulator